MDILLRDAKFWIAIVLLLKVVLFYAIPAFPEEIWVAVDALLAVVIGAFAGVATRQMVVARRIRNG